MASHRLKQFIHGPGFRHQHTSMFDIIESLECDDFGDERRSPVPALIPSVAELAVVPADVADAQLAVVPVHAAVVARPAKYADGCTVRVIDRAKHRPVTSMKGIGPYS